MNIIICGVIPNNPFPVKITDSAQTTVSDLKAMTSSKTGIPKEELILHFSDDILPDDTPLSQWKEMRSGAAVLATIKPLIVTLQRYNSDIDVTVEIPRLAIKKWSTRKFFYYCLFKGGLPQRNNGTYVFAVRGSIMKEEGKMMSDYDWCQNDFTISVTLILEMKMPDHTQLGNYYCPSSSSSVMKKTLGSETVNSYSENQQIWGEKNFNESELEKECLYLPTLWKLNVQKLDGTLNTVDVSPKTPAYKLKQQISPDTNIRLTFGTTVLEDWDDEGNMMLLCSYPDLHDGATLCQINLTEAVGIKWVRLVKKKELGWNNSIRLHDYQNLVEGHHKATPPAIITVDDPKHFTVKKLTRILESIGVRSARWGRKESIYEWKETSANNFCTGRELRPESDDVISSIDYIYDGCTLAIK